MKYVVDIHTHSIASGHAYSTIKENAKYASRIGIEVLGITDHAPSLPGAPHLWHFANYKVLPKKIYGVSMLYGCEANIIDYDGNIDLPEEIQKKLDIMIISFHEPIMEDGKSPDLNTKAMLKAMDNPYADVLGHLGNPRFPINAEEIVKKAKEKNILIEINNSSFAGSRAGSSENCKKIALLCKEYGVKIIMSSDAHYCEQVGNFKEAGKMLKEISMPGELIINKSKHEFLDFLEERKSHINP